MKLDNMLPFRKSVCLGIALWTLRSRADDYFQSYCSTDNSGSDYTPVFNTWQSNGACHDTCVGGGYAFAVVQYQYCWCSNYLPAQQANVGSDCSQHCPGFPDELCGDADKGYYGYIALGPQPSGTAGVVAQASSQTSAAPSTSTTTSTTTTTPTTSSTHSTTPPSSHTSTTPSPVTSIILKTVSGNVVTQTVTSTPTVVPDSNLDTTQIQRQSGVPAGTVAGIVIGVVAGLALLALAAFLLWRRKRNSNDAENHGGSASGSQKSMKRNVSVLSKAGLLNRTRPSMSEREHDDSYHIPAVGAGHSVRHSMMFGSADGVSPTSPLDSGHSDSSQLPGKPMVYDQRLNPSALFANQEANGSRVSMQDTQDYSRPLGVMNPDPRASFESRISRA